MQQQQQQKQEQEERATQKKQILKQLLDNDALDRLSRISLVNKEKADNLENFIIGKVQKGEITSKVNDSQFLKYVDEMTASGAGRVGAIKIQRRCDDSDDDLDLEDD